MEENKKLKQIKNFELRSEKVRSIVGQVPPILLRYGITIIGIILLILLGISYYLPYKQVYSGTATIHRIPQCKTDSVNISILLEFKEKRPNLCSIKDAKLFLIAPNTTIQGHLTLFSAKRDTLGRNIAKVRLPVFALKSIEYSEVDFTLTQDSTNLLGHFFGK